jgi:glucokinase
MSIISYRLGVDVGGTNLVAAVVDGSFRILSKVSIPAGAHRGIDEITGDIVRVSRMAVEEAGIPMEKVSSWGIGMPSCINPSTGLLVHANCFGWKNVPIFHYLEGKLPLPLKIENDASCTQVSPIDPLDP